MRLAGRAAVVDMYLDVSQAVGCKKEGQHRLVGPMMGEVGYQPYMLLLEGEGVGY